MNLMSYVQSVSVSALILYLGTTRIIAGTMPLGPLLTYIAFLGLLIAPVAQIVSIGTQLTEGMAGLERTSDILAEKPEDQDPKRSVSIGKIVGEIAFENVDFTYAEGKPVLHDVSFQARPGSVTALVGPSGVANSTIIALIVSV